MTAMPVTTNATGLRVIRYAKLCSQAFAANHDTGIAISSAKETNNKKSFESMATTLLTDAPITLRMPISFCLFCAVKAAKPNKPRQEITMVIAAKYFDSSATLCSDTYNLL